MPLDGSQISEQVLPYVRQLARRFEARVRLFSVLEPIAAGLVELPQSIPLLKAMAEAHDQIRHRLEVIADSLQGGGLDVTLTTGE